MDQNLTTEMAELAAEKAAPQKPVTDEIASIGKKDITYGFVGNILINPDNVLATEGGYGSLALEIYEDLERDSHVFSEMQKRKNAVSGREWQITPASDASVDVEIAEWIKQCFLALPFGNTIKSMLDAKLKGFSVGEVMWKIGDDGEVCIKEIIGRDQRRFVFDIDRRLRLLTPSQMVDGEEVPDRKFIVLSSGSKIGNPYGSGLGARLYWPVWFKKNGVRFWAIFLEKFGSPTAVGKYPPGTPKPQQEQLLDAIEAIQQETAVKIPDNMIIELLEAQRAGSIDSYERWLTYWDTAITLVILGETLTTSVGDSGSRALGEVHNEVRLDLVKDDADEISECLNTQLIPWMVDYNFAGVKVYPKFWIRTEPEKDLSKLAERDERLVRMGLPIGEKYFYDTYNIPEPAEGERVVVAPAPAGFPGLGGTPAFSQGQQQTKLDPFVDRLMREANVDPLIDPIAKLVQEAGSLEALRDRLFEAKRDMDPIELGNLMQLAFAAAELLGRFETEGGGDGD